MHLRKSVKAALLGIFALSLLFTSCTTAQNPTFDVTYEITGTKYTQLFEVTPSQFLDRFNELVDDDLKLDYLESFTNDDSSWPLTANGETWTILLDVFSSADAGFTAKSQENNKDLVGLIQKITLSTYASDDTNAEANGVYLRTLITMFTPGGETFVEDYLGIYGEPDEKAVVTDGLTMVTMENVSYAYQKESNKFIISPAAEDGWYEEEPEQTNIIRPN